MTPEQLSAFKIASGYEADKVSLFISLIGATLLFLFCAWVIYSAYQGWTDKSLKMGQLGLVIFRCTVLIFVLLYILTN